MKNTSRGILISIPAFILVVIIGYFLGGGGATGLIVGLTIGLLVVLAIMLLFGLVKSQTAKKYTGKESLIGSYGTVKETLSPEGWVSISGTMWQGRSSDGSTIEKNAKVQIVDFTELTVIVKKVQDSSYSRNQ